MLISYTKEKKTVEVFLTEEKEQAVKKSIAEVYKIIDRETPPPLKKLRYCKSCAYYNFCFSREDDDDDA
ncbi:Dna2/Cas4 domain-containing protein [Niallia sp. 03133]|uniref:Dna2/Cas4 domain-containing protein n=1 Tax=Niallia sp. 03133 TaxID=3458060 RepID=UPI004043D4A9